MIQTERLIILPLSYGQLEKYIRNDHSLDMELNLNTTSRIMSQELREALTETILPNVADTSKNYLFSTLWTIILKTQNKMAGDLCFVGEPNEEGEVEIGYGTYQEFQGKGYMTEAIRAMNEWAARQSDVKAIVASTEKTNAASFSVLQKNDFNKSGEDDSMCHWRKELI